MICYFGKDERGFFVMQEATEVKRYMPEDVWKSLVKAGAHAGADISEPLIKLKIKEELRLEKFDSDGNLVETVFLQQDGDE